MADLIPEPHNLEAECAVLGAGLQYADALEQAAEALQAEDFYRAAHQVLFRTMVRLWRQHEPVDTVTVKNALQASGELDAVNGPAYIASLTDGVPRSANVTAYARIVREKAALRQLAALGRRTLAAALDASDDAAALINQCQQGAYEIAVQRTSGGFVTMRDVVSGEVMPWVESVVQHKRTYTGVTAGLIDLDQMTRGFQKSDLILLAARPSMGKTALAMSAALHAATVGEAHVGVFSLEMSKRDLALRAVIAESRIDGMRVRAGRIYDHEWATWAQALGVVADARLHIDDTAGLTVQDIRTRARRLKGSVGLDLIVVDYLQLIQPTDKRESRNLDITEISMGLKRIAKELDVPVLALSQLSRACEARTNKRPQLSDLRESGSLEQDADLVIFIYRDEVYDEHSADRGIAELIIGKYRNGPTGTVKVGFDKGQTRFFNLTRERVA